MTEEPKENSTESTDVQNDSIESKEIDALMMRDSRRSQDDEVKGSATWLVSFTDVVALMLTFFVLLYAMSDPVQEKWEEKLGMMVEGKKKYDGGPDRSGVNEGDNISRIDYNQADKLEYVEAVLAEIWSQNEKGKGIRYTRDHDVLILTVEHDFFNDDGALKRRSRHFLRQISGVLDRFENQMVIFYPLYGAGQGDSFLQAQNLGKAFKKTGYHNDIEISLRGDIAFEKETLRILIKPHDGHRITRL